MLESLSPLAVLGRGYAIISNTDGRALRRADDTRTGERLTARLGRGQLEVEVVKTRASPED
jgi:exodeoxyribonuclease VII large subunit